MFQSFRPDASDIFYFLLRRRAINDRLMLAERAFLDSDGLPGPGRQWYKHLVSGSLRQTSLGFASCQSNGFLICGLLSHSYLNSNTGGVNSEPTRQALHGVLIPFWSSRWFCNFLIAVFNMEFMRFD